FFRRYSLLAEACFFVLVLILVVSVFLTTRFGRSSLRLGSRSCSRWFSACISTLASRRLGSRFGSRSFCVCSRLALFSSNVSSRNFFRCRCVLLGRFNSRRIACCWCIHNSVSLGGLSFSSLQLFQCLLFTSQNLFFVLRFFQRQVTAFYVGAFFTHFHAHSFATALASRGF